MHYQPSYLFVFLLLSAAVLAAPIERLNKSFKIHSRQVASSRARDGAIALDRAYRKYGWPVPHKSNSTARNKVLSATGNENERSKVDATPEEGDAEFLSPITIGGQMLMMNFDTGSSDLWVFNTQLERSETLGHTPFDPSKSTTFRTLNGASFSISYGDSSKAQGTVGFDTVDIGGAKVEQQAIELATDVTDSFIQDVDSDGLVGLGFSSINTVKPTAQKTFFDNIQPSLAAPVFTANLRHATVGAYEFGRIDPTQFHGDIHYTPVDPSQGFWQLASPRYAVGHGAVQRNENASPAIADTGTSLMLVDDAVVRAYWSQVRGAQMDQQAGGSGGGGVTFPCDAELPDFHVALGGEEEGYMATIPGELMSFQRLGANVCFGGLQSNLGQPLQIYGDVLFKAQFVVFDGGRKRIGFAPLAEV
ncbi:MAG: hypothetical protein Q9214_000582 [Letrouitia sp. 1 TL-2023]